MVLVVCFLGAILNGVFGINPRTVRQRIREASVVKEEVPARLLAKRHEIRLRGGDKGRYTVYFVTFELRSEQRLEFQVEGPESGLLAEGDRGTLRFQGTRYRGFDRLPQDR
nr:DUF2500 domain-containing protein [Kineosporia babensis]